MTRIIDQYPPMEIIGNEELQSLAQREILNRNKILYKVNEMLSFPREGFISIKGVAELYEVEEKKLFNLLDIEEELEGELNVLVSRMDMFNIAFFLNNSEVAKELRKQLSSVRDSV